MPSHWTEPHCVGLSEYVVVYTQLFHSLRLKGPMLRSVFSGSPFALKSSTDVSQIVLGPHGFGGG